MTPPVQSPSQPRVAAPNSGQKANGSKNGQNGAPEEIFKDVKHKFICVGGGIAGVSALALVAGAFRYGATFPARAVKLVSDFFGSLAAISAPVFLIGNEALNYYARKENGNGNGRKARVNEIREIFDAAREGHYRLTSSGFIGYILEPFINPEKFGKTLSHKIATVVNLPSLLFSGIMWGGGNLQALVAWGLRSKEQFSAYRAGQSGNKKSQEESNKRVAAYNRLYSSFKRQTVIGSINNPTMQGIRQFADSIDLITGNMPLKEYFSNPAKGISRLTSLFVGLPELYSKSVDSFVRVVKERENLKVGLPEFLSKPLERLGTRVDKAIATPVGKKNSLKSIRNLAEKLFHTISPLSMASLFTPLFAMNVTNEDAQSKGETSGLVDRILGIGNKAFTVLFNGLYVGFGRIPQFFIQSVYFVRKAWGRRRGETEEQSKAAVERIRKNICNSSFVKGISKFARNVIKKLVPDFYDADHEHGYSTYEQIQANYSFEQAKGTSLFKEIISLGEEYSSSDSSARQNLNVKINQKINLLFKQSCLPYITNDATQGDRILPQSIINKIKDKVTKRVKQDIGILAQDKRAPLPFIGSEFLATNVFKLLDLESMFNSISYNSDHENMTTTYENLEVRIGFEYELLPVLGKCVHGLQNIFNRAQGFTVMDPFASHESSKEEEPLFSTAS